MRNLISLILPLRFDIDLSLSHTYSSAASNFAAFSGTIAELCLVSTFADLVNRFTTCPVFWTFFFYHESHDKTTLTITLVSRGNCFAKWSNDSVVVDDLMSIASISTAWIRWWFERGIVSSSPISALSDASFVNTHLRIDFTIDQPRQGHASNTDWKKARRIDWQRPPRNFFNSSL